MPKTSRPTKVLSKRFATPKPKRPKKNDEKKSPTSGKKKSKAAGASRRMQTRQNKK